MDEKLKNLLADATDESLFAWTDPKMVGRAYGYLDKVEGLSFVEGQGVFAKVHGSEDYYTRVFCDESGGLESVCSCPVGHRCKHAVAAIICASRLIGNGASIPECTSDSELWQSAEKAFEEVKARILERERKILEQRAAKEREEAELLRWLEERRASALELFNGFLEKMVERSKAGDLKGVLGLLGEACAATDDDFDIEPYGRELYGLIDEMSRIAIEAMNMGDMPDKDKLLFAHDAEVPYRYYASPRLIYDELWEGPKSNAFAEEVWGGVGDILKSRLNENSFVEKCGFHALCFTVADACDAYWRAGRGEDAFAVRKRFAAKTESWCDCADDLCRLGRREEAKSFLLESWKFVRSPEREEWSDGCYLIEKLAEVYAGEGDYAYATALLAENWLSLVGGMDHCGDCDALERILDMAGKAGCRHEVLAALSYAVDTGFPPITLTCNEEPGLVRGKEFRFPLPMPKEPPPWPLPATGLDFGRLLPIFTIDAHWWEAEALLVRVAIREGLLDEAACRFFALPGRPGGCFGVSPEDRLTDFEREAKTALFDKYPKVAAKIAATQECREWGSKHLGEKLPEEMKERLFPLMNIPLDGAKANSGAMRYDDRQ